mmetsp:Transcript_44885/g.116228  ORF Transcript_44885/g.116228 Transcript_44885/m.116228 type:complete len:218 (+) Transcript_44885:127-780(+)
MRSGRPVRVTSNTASSRVCNSTTCGGHPLSHSKQPHRLPQACRASHIRRAFHLVRRQRPPRHRHVRQDGCQVRGRHPRRGGRAELDALHAYCRLRVPVWQEGRQGHRHHGRGGPELRLEPGLALPRASQQQPRQGYGGREAARQQLPPRGAVLLCHHQAAGYLGGAVKKRRLGFLRPRAQQEVYRLGRDAAVRAVPRMAQPPLEEVQHGAPPHHGGR